MGDTLSGIGGNYTSYYNYKANSAVAKANARIARAQGESAKNNWYAQATRREYDSKLKLEENAEQLAALRKQGTLARGAVRAQAGARGFTEQGTGSMPEKSVLAQVEDKANALANAASTQDAIYRWQAATMRQYGNQEVQLAEINARSYEAQARMYDTMASGAKRAGNFSAIVTAVGTVLGGTTGMMIGSTIGDIYGNSQVGSVQNLYGMSEQSQNVIGALAFGTSTKLSEKAGLSGTQDAVSDALLSWLV